MKKYDLIVIGTGSAMNTVGPFLERNPGAKIAVIDKDPPGGICLTKGCIPTKLLVYPAELIRLMEDSGGLGVHFKIDRIDFQSVMNRMRSLVQPEIESIRKSLSEAKGIDYYPEPARFTGPYALRVGKVAIGSDMIFLCLGSRPRIPAIENLDSVKYYTSDSILEIDHPPGDMAIVGGGYIAAEYGHFFSAMGVKVTIVGRNSRFLPEEEPEVSGLAQKEMSRHMGILTGHEVFAVQREVSGKITIRAVDRLSGKKISIPADVLLLAAGRESTADLLHPEKSGVRTDRNGWVLVNQYLETTQRNIWALGDAVGVHPFKHVANYESQILYYNAVLKEKIPVDYHAVPHAVFAYPEIAAVGLKEKEAVERYGSDRVLIGFQRYEDTAKGQAMGVRDYFVKVIVEDETARILGAHVIGPQASVLIQELITLMYTRDQTIHPIVKAMHIHPALSEVIGNAVADLMPVDQYHRLFI
jgi:dihydrolipoamide dehydrogenase